MGTKPTTAVVQVTPDQAAEWLANNNNHNRTIRESKVAAYARDMKSGAWQFNGDSVRFADDGTLLDGQHRLSAIIRSGMAVSVIVVWGLEKASQNTMDIGAHRLLRDQLHLAGESNSNELAAIARRMVAIGQGVMGKGGQNMPTHAEMIDYIDANPDVRRAAEVACSAKGKVPVAPSVIGTAYHWCARIEKSDAEVFYVTQVIECIGLYEGDPARALLLRYQNDAAVTGRQMDPDNALRYAIVAWNHFRKGAKVSKLQAPKGGWGNGNMPPRTTPRVTTYSTPRRTAMASRNTGGRT
jgi:hypothetical protein